MTCDSVQQTFPAFVGGDLRRESMDRVRSHLDDCPTCFAAFAPYQRASAALAMVAPMDESVPAGLVEDILESVHAPSRRLIPLPPVVAGDVARLVADNREALASAAGALAAVAVAGGAVWAVWRTAQGRARARTATS